MTAMHLPGSKPLVRSSVDPGDTRAQHVLQHPPGETIYVLPFGFLHSVYNVRDAIAVTANFGSLVVTLLTSEELF